MVTFSGGGDSFWGACPVLVGAAEGGAGVRGTEVALIDVGAVVL